MAGSALADGNHALLFGYNNRGEKAIVQIQVFTSFILRAKLMEHLTKARVLAIFSDAESARYDKVLMFGVHTIVNGYCCPLPLSFSLGGVSVTGETLHEALIQGVTACNILSGGSQLIPELAVDVDSENVAWALKRIQHLNKYTPIGMKYENFIPKLSNSLTDGDSKYRFRLLKLLQADQKEF